MLLGSQDILNNLDSCDLEDDDLMLDVDLPEDAPLEDGELGPVLEPGSCSQELTGFFIAKEPCRWFPNSAR